MKKKRKAFTLIELLAVIIVLAIIALIAMPIIFNVIENAKVKSLENSAYGVVDAVRLHYMENLMNSEDGTVPLEGSVTTLSLSGEHPTEGTWKIVNDADLEDGRGIQIIDVTFASMEGYKCNSVIENGELTGEVACTKQESQEPSENGIVFEVADGVINENGWANEPFDVTVTVNGASSFKGCLAYDGECTSEIPTGYTCKENNFYDYVVNDSACLKFGLDNGLSQSMTESLCEDADKSLVNLAESIGVSGQSLVDAGVISNLVVLGTVNVCVNSTSGDEKTIFDMQTNTATSKLYNDGNNYVCIEAEGLQSKCEVFKLDSITPTITPKTIYPAVKVGESNNVSTLFNAATYGVSGGSVVCKDSNDNLVTNTNSLTEGTHILKCSAAGNNSLNSDNVELKLLVGEEATPNAPELFTNMIPVVYNSTNSTWEYANKNSKWYDYSEKQWANAVVLKANPSKTYGVGDSIDMSDIAQMYVWIPRYKYTIFNGNNGVIEDPIEINVIFEEGTATTGTVKCYDAINQTDSDENAISEICTDSTQTNNAIVDNVSTYTHPAFCLGRKNTDGSCNGTELTGIWVGKFETSGTASASQLTVVPNKDTLTTTTLSSFFTAMSGVANSYNIKVNSTTYADSHMMKNMDWGAVAYLKQSKYGLMLTEIASNEYWNSESSSSYMTGCVVPYDDDGMMGGEACTPYNTIDGMAASTTGNIYGIYDMAGGATEYVMGNMVDSSGSSNTSDKVTFTPMEKYYDVYTYDTSECTHSRGKLGDATKETLERLICDEYSKGGGWYHNGSAFPNTSRPWFARGGSATYYPGLFSFRDIVGNSDTITSRIVITQP